MRIIRLALASLFSILLALVLLEATLTLGAHLLTPRRATDERALLAAKVVVYGDSTPYGLGNTIRFSDEMQARLGVPVANRSWPGLNSTQISRIVEEDLARYRPAAIIVMAGVNDGWNTEDVPPELLGSATRWFHLLPNLRTLRLLRIGIEGGLGRRAYDSAFSRGWGRREQTSRLLSTDQIAAIHLASYRRIFDAAENNGVEVLFVGYQAEGYNHVADLAETVLQSHYASSLVSIRSHFTENGERLMIQPDAFHPTDEGQRLIGTLVSHVLLTRNWLVQPPAHHAGP